MSVNPFGWPSPNQLAQIRCGITQLGRIDRDCTVDHPARGAHGRRVVNADGSDDPSTVHCEHRKRRLAEDASVSEPLRVSKLANNFHMDAVAVSPKPGRGVG